MMNRRAIPIILALGMWAIRSEASDVEVFLRYQAIVQSETAAPVAIEKGQQYLVSLGHDDFMLFIREAGRQPQYARDNVDSVFAMAFFAKSYVAGPGKTEPLIATLGQLSDATLPSSWKLGLLNVLRLENRVKLTEEELAAAISVLSEMGQMTTASDAFRTVSLQKLDSILHTQGEILAQEAPEVKDALEKLDISALPKRDDANIKRARELIEAIQGHRELLQRTSAEVRDEQMKTNLKQRLTKWGPVRSSK